MAGKRSLRQWLWEQRTSSRLAYLLQVGSRILTSALALFWIRLLVGAMGIPLNGLFLAFQSVFSLGGLGDLGMGGAVSLRVGQYLGAGKSKEAELQKFLASARMVFLLLAVACGVGVLALSPWLPRWLEFPTVTGAGPLTNVFGVGAMIIACVLLFSYLSNLNYACGNIAWPVLPDFALLQISMLCHWWLARHEQPLWVQYLPYLMSAAVKLFLMRTYVRISHPALSRMLPLTFDRALMGSLLEGSFWVYLCVLGNSIYRNTDALVINAGFPAGTLPGYTYNYKFCEIMVFVVSTASFVILPKMTQWMASPDPKDHERVRVEMRRLNQFQTLLGCGASLAYLAGNDIFMKVWWLHKANPILPAALPLQLAFALNLAVTASGDAGLQLAFRAGSRGLRFVGGTVALTGLLNVALSIVAMKMGSLQGIALATVVAQSLAMLASSYYISRYLKMAWLPWAFKGCFLPLLGISFAGWLRMQWPLDTWPHIFMLVGAYAGMLLAAAWGLGVNAALIREELKVVEKFFGR